VLKKIFLILLITFLYFINSFSQTDNAKSLTDNPTQIKKYVVDETNTLTPEQVNALLKKLVDFEKQTSNQIIIYIIESLNGEPIENAAYKIASANKIGKKDKNNGVLFLIAIKDKKMRIEVGYGLEGALTDAISSSILRNEVTPSFREGKYFEGVSKGLDAIMLATKNEYKNTDKNTDKTLQSADSNVIGGVSNENIKKAVVIGGAVLLSIVGIFIFGRTDQSKSTS